MKKVTLIFIFLITQFVISQSKISGSITSLGQKPITGATVVIENNSRILAYAITNEKGYYKIIYTNPKKDTLTIEVSFLGFKKIVNTSQTLNFILEESSEPLKEVVIKAPPPIAQKGDTLSYNVSSFKDKKDQVIADVLAKMPGIEVESDVRILYEGKAIEKYYIEGLDLLEGKYNLANNNLPASAVSKVQILENHQLIKLLDSLVFSDKTSINIKLKNDISFTGQAKLGSGFLPALWSANITPMLFTKKQQMISSYQSNNIGNDVTKEVKSLTIQDLLDRIDNIQTCQVFKT